jgi:hypothetical protein
VNPTKPFFIVIYPYKFTDFVGTYLEVEAFRKYCNVEVWDISAFAYPEFSNSISASRSSSNCVVLIESFRSFFTKARRLRKYAQHNRVCILNAVPKASFYTALVNIVLSVFLKHGSVAIMDIYNGGLPTYYPGQEQPAQNGVLQRIRSRLGGNSSLGELRKMVAGSFFSRLAAVFPPAITHSLVAGEHYMTAALAAHAGKKNVQIVKGHCQDYSNYLLTATARNLEPDTDDRQGVLLDAPGPMFTSDYAHLGRKIYFTSEVWYPAVCHFFDKLESTFDITMKIAGHYKAAHPPVAACFGYRSVLYNRTRELVQNSKVVVTRASAAISFAVLFRKPVIFIYSDQLKDDMLSMTHTFGLASMLGTIPINIDHPPADLGPYLNVDEDSYAAYEKACLTSTSSKRPNVQIILEDVLHIDTGTDFSRTPNTQLTKANAQ